MKITVVSDVTLCSLVDDKKDFGGISLNIEAARSFRNVV
jgi:hypothetical protein